jgi:hypothetical protein
MSDGGQWRTDGRTLQRTSGVRAPSGVRQSAPVLGDRSVAQHCGWWTPDAHWLSAASGHGCRCPVRCLQRTPWAGRPVPHRGQHRRQRDCACLAGQRTANGRSSARRWTPTPDGGCGRLNLPRAPRRCVHADRFRRPARRSHHQLGGRRAPADHPWHGLAVLRVGRNPDWQQGERERVSASQNCSLGVEFDQRGRRVGQVLAASCVTFALPRPRLVRPARRSPAPAEHQ